MTKSANPPVPDFKGEAVEPFKIEDGWLASLTETDFLKNWDGDGTTWLKPASQNSGDYLVALYTHFGNFRKTVRAAADYLAVVESQEQRPGVACTPEESAIIDAWASRPKFGDTPEFGVAKDIQEARMMQTGDPRNELTDARARQQARVHYELVAKASVPEGVVQEDSNSDLTDLALARAAAARSRRI